MGDDSPNISEIRLAVHKYAARMIVPNLEEMVASTSPGFMRDEIAVQLVRRVATIEGKSDIQVPASWVDHWLTAWYKRHDWRGKVARFIERRRPIEYTVHKAVLYLPDVPLPSKYPYELRIASWEPPTRWRAL